MCLGLYLQAACSTRHARYQTASCGCAPRARAAKCRPTDETNRSSWGDRGHADRAERHLLKREPMPPLQRDGDELRYAGARLARSVEEDALFRQRAAGRPQRRQQPCMQSSMLVSLALDVPQKISAAMHSLCRMQLKRMLSSGALWAQMHCLPTGSSHSSSIDEHVQGFSAASSGCEKGSASTRSWKTRRGKEARAHLQA